MNTGRHAGPFTYLAAALLILFGLTDLAAEITGDGKGKWGETFSTLIHHLEKRRWWVRGGVGAITVWLFLHLTLGVA